MSEEKEKIWIVEVTYGTRPHSIYASVPSQESAEKLREAALKLGYRDAKVVSAEEFYKAQEESRRRSSLSEGVHRGGGRVHGMRPHTKKRRPPLCA